MNNYYIVQGRFPGEHTRCLMCLSVGMKSVLYFGRPVTLFPDYEAARNAIRRTVRYAKRRRLILWGDYNDFRIIRCVMEGDKQ
jgi:hypothetical protein